MGQFCQPLGIALAGDDRLNDLAARKSRDIGNNRIQLDVGLFEGLLYPKNMAALP
jgi:hypothetical protein